MHTSKNNEADFVEEVSNAPVQDLVFNARKCEYTVSVDDLNVIELNEDNDEGDNINDEELSEDDDDDDVPGTIRR